MRFVSLNAWGGQVWPALGDWAAAIGADILCLQEVIRAPEPGPAWLTYVDPYRRLDQRADLFGDISARLPAHQARFAAAARGTLQDDGGRDFASEHGIAVWVAPRLAITEQTQAFIHGTFRADGWGEEPVPRTMQVLRLCDPATGGVLTFGHLHGLRDPAGKGDTPARLAQAHAIADAVQSVRQPGDPVILAGDLNLLPDSATFDVLREIGLCDLVTARGHTDTRTSLYPGKQRFADYLLVSHDLRLHRFDLPAQPEVSDHRALVLDFDM